jgi:hypothetical protein
MIDGRELWKWNGIKGRDHLSYYANRVHWVKDVTGGGDVK